MQLLVNKVLTLMMVIFFKMTSPKAVCILFQALTALIVIKLFPYELVRKKCLNNLPIEEAAVLYLCNISLKAIYHGKVYRPRVHSEVEFCLQI